MRSLLYGSRRRADFIQIPVVRTSMPGRPQAIGLPTGNPDYQRVNHEGRWNVSKKATTKSLLSPTTGKSLRFA